MPRSLLSPQKTGLKLAAADREAANLPALILAAEKLAASLAAGEQKKRKPGTGEEFWQYRPYQTGDTQKQVDWRRSAKSDQLYIRETEHQISQSLFFWMAGGPDMAYRSDLAEESKQSRGTLILTALAVMAQRSGSLTGLASDGKALRGPDALFHIAEDCLHASKSALPAPPDILPKQATVILAGDFWDTPESLTSKLDLWAGLSDRLILLQIADPAELTFPFRGHVVFHRDQEDKERFPFQGAESVRDNYLARLHAHQAALRKLMARHNGRFVVHGTDAPPIDALRALYDCLAEPQDHGGRR